jgi:hypothetical protein
MNKMKKELMEVIEIKGGTQSEKTIAVKVIDWCLDHFNLGWYGININMEICKYKTYKCWGTCVDDEEEYNEFHLTIANDQSIRDFVATITHEMIHVKQYATGKWRGDGEKECERLQYKLADKLWNEGIL